MTFLAALQNAPATGTRLLTLRFDDPALTTTLALEGRGVRGVRGPVTPSWHTTLRHHGVHPATLLVAQQRTRTLSGALDLLQREGVLAAPEVARLAQGRVLHALLPLLGRPATLHAHPGPVGTAPSVPLDDTLAQLSAVHAGAPLPLTTPYAASPARVPPAADGTPDDLVYRAALHGWTLQDMARRLPLRWDALRATAVRLTVTGDIWPATTTRPAPVHARLRAGQLAPDFRLPALGGGDVRLHDLRGQRVWLSFNRQATCAICNPRHAEVIAAHPHLQGVTPISVWGSTLADLAQGVGRQQPPYAVLADPGDLTEKRRGSPWLSAWGGTGVPPIGGLAVHTRMI